MYAIRSYYARARRFVGLGLAVDVELQLRRLRAPGASDDLQRNEPDAVIRVQHP